jgi:hypothetical protein
MPNDDDKPAVKERSDDGKERNPVQAEAQPGAEQLDRITEALSELRKASEDLKARIAEARRRNECLSPRPSGTPIGNGTPPMGASMFLTRKTTSRPFRAQP